MANSYEIAQMFAQQNQMFMGTNQFASSMGVPSPMMQGGMGGPGVGGTGFSAPRGGGGFNFGQSPMMGYGPGNSVAGGMMSGAGAAFSGGSMALSAMGSMGMLGKAGALMDPFAMGARAFGMMGGGMAGGLAAAGAFAAPLAIGMGISHGVQSFVHGGQQQGQMNTMLGSQYQFFNPSSRTGSGFTRDDAKSIGDMTRSLSHIPEMMTSFDELSQIMSRMKSSGVMSGARTAADFQTRFREAIGTIRETAKVLGTTMEEAEHFFTQSRGSGFYGRQAQLKNAVSAQFTAGVTGASVGQVAGLQAAGADMAMQFGARRGLGAQAVTNMAQNIGLAQASGKFREGAVEDVTGMQGPEAQLALAQKMFGGMMRFGQTAPGRLAMAGMMKFEGDKAVGVDEDMAKRFNQGLVSIDELKQRAGKLTDKQKISFTARNQDLIASLAGQIGPGGAFQMMSGALGGKGDEATNLVMQRLTGMSAGELDIAQGMSGVSGEGQEGAMARLRQKQSSQRERTDPSAIWQRLKTGMHAKTFGKLEQMGADVHTSIAKSIDSFFDDFVGREISTLTEEKAKAISQGFASGTGPGTEMIRGLMKMQNTPGKAPSSFMGLQRASPGESMLARGLAYLPGGQRTAGQMQELTSSLFGTSKGSDQDRIANFFSQNAGKMAGSGADMSVARIRAKEGFSGKSAAEQLEMITGGLKERTESVLGKVFGKDSKFTKDAMAGKDLDYIDRTIASSDLSAEEKSLISSYTAAQRSKVGGGNVFMQMAGASGAADIMKAAAGGAQMSLADLSKSVREKQSMLSKSIGEVSAGFVSGSADKRKAFEAAINDASIVNDLRDGRHGDVKAKLASKGIELSDADIAGLGTSVNDFLGSGKQQKEGMAAIKDFSQYSDALAAKEYLSNMNEQGRKLLGTAGGAGKTADAQKRLASAMKGIGSATTQEDYDKAKKEYDAALGDYTKQLGTLKGDELSQAVEAGGSVARGLTSGREAMAAKLAKGGFKDANEIAKLTGMSPEDVKGIVGTGRSALSKDQISRLVEGSSKVMAAANIQGGDAEGGTKAKSTTEKLNDTLTKIDANQSTIATVLSAVVKDPELSARLGKMASASHENSNAGAGGQTDVSPPKR